jgi:uncharacterized protein (TIGR00730 family)
MPAPRLRTAPRPLICVFAGAQDPEDPAILKAARELGTAIGEGGYDILYGGGSRGVMGEVTMAAYKAGANVKAALLKRFSHDKEATPAEIVGVVENEFQRFPLFLAQNPVALFVLPGGSGTLREALQGIEMAIYNEGPPVVLARVGKHLSGIRAEFNHSVDAGLIKPEHINVLRDWHRGQPISEVLEARSEVLGTRDARVNTPRVRVSI